MSTDNSSLMAKIRALMAKAESTEFEHEAAAYLAKAEELMLKHDIERSDLAPEERDKVASTMVTIGANGPDHILWNSVALSRDVKFIRMGGKGADRSGTLIGFTADLEYVQTLVTSLMLQRERSLAREQKPSWENGRTFNHSFRTGYANRIFQRLMAAKEQAKKSTGNTVGTDLVLASKEQHVARRVSQLFPKTTNARFTAAHSRVGFSAGGEAGSRASLNLGEKNLSHSRRAVATH